MIRIYDDPSRKLSGVRVSDDPRIDYPSTHEFSLANLYRNISILQYVNIQFFDPKICAEAASPNNNDFSQSNLYRNISILQYVNIQFFDPKICAGATSLILSKFGQFCGISSSKHQHSNIVLCAIDQRSILVFFVSLVPLWTELMFRSSDNPSRKLSGVR